MAIQQQVSEDGAIVTISVDGRFDFSSNKEFREAYRRQAVDGVKFRVDLSATQYMDSSALGMLLLLREHAGGDDAGIVLERPQAAVRKVLEIANFDQLFTIE